MATDGDKDEYFILNIQFKDIVLDNPESNSFEFSCAIIVNGTFDDILKLNQEQNLTTLFLHKSDIVCCEVKYFDQMMKILGTCEFSGLDILEKQQLHFAQWLNLKGPNKSQIVPKILLDFGLQFINETCEDNQARIRNSNPREEAAAGNKLVRPEFDCQEEEATLDADIPNPHCAQLNARGSGFQGNNAASQSKPNALEMSFSGEKQPS